MPRIAQSLLRWLASLAALSGGLAAAQPIVQIVPASPPFCPLSSTRRCGLRRSVAIGRSIRLRAGRLYDRHPTRQIIGDKLAERSGR